MRGLNKILPPFSTDVSGACSALFDLGGIVVVHEPACCTSCFTSFDEPRYYGSTSPLYSSELREIHISTGDDETILRRIEAASKIVESKFIAIIGSPLPMFSGTDNDALASELERRTGIPSFSVETGGFDWYEKGISKALLKLSKKFINNGNRKDIRSREGNEMNSINLIGATPIDGIRIRGKGSLVEHLCKRGYSIKAILSESTSIDEISRAAEANLNIVISSSGMEAAEYLQKEFGTPYFCGLPIGKYEMKMLRHKAADKKVLIIGDQIISNSIRNCLKTDLGIQRVLVSSFFTMNASLSQIDDVKLRDEDDLTNLLIHKNIDILIGDPVFFNFTKHLPEIKHIAIPHIAVSGYSPFIQIPNLVGKEGFHYLKESLDKLYL